MRLKQSLANITSYESTTYDSQYEVKHKSHLLVHCCLGNNTFGAINSLVALLYWYTRLRKFNSLYRILNLKN